MKTLLTIEIIKKLAPEIGATVMVEPEYGFVGHITFKNGKKTFFRNTSLNINRDGSGEIARDKGYASFFLKQFGYNVPEGQTFFSDSLCENVSIKRNIDDGFYFAKALGYPVIVKPNNLSQGKLVTKVHTKKEYYETAKKIFQKTSVLIVQRFYAGKDYRLLVLDDEIIAAYQRIPLFVVGDGKSSILELLRQKQETFSINYRKAPIDFEDFRIKRKLQRQRLSWNSVILEGTRVDILDNANLSGGGSAVDVTKDVNPDFYKLAVSITKDMGLRLCGVDIITSDITSPMRDYVIIEINATPGLDNYASIGENQRKIAEELYLKILKALESE